MIIRHIAWIIRQLMSYILR